MSVYYCDISCMIEQLRRYEGVNTLESVPVDRHASKLYADFVPVCDRDIELVWQRICPYHPMFCYLFSLKTCMSVYYYDNIGMVERLPGCEGVPTLESMPVDHRTSILR